MKISVKISTVWGIFSFFCNFETSRQNNFFFFSVYFHLVLSVVENVSIMFRLLLIQATWSGDGIKIDNIEVFPSSLFPSSAYNYSNRALWKLQHETSLSLFLSFPVMKYEKMWEVDSLEWTETLARVEFRWVDNNFFAARLVECAHTEHFRKCSITLTGGLHDRKLTTQSHHSTFQRAKSGGLDLHTFFSAFFFGRDLDECVKLKTSASPRIYSFSSSNYFQVWQRNQHEDGLAVGSKRWLMSLMTSLCAAEPACHRITWFTRVDSFFFMRNIWKFPSHHDRSHTPSLYLVDPSTVFFVCTLPMRNYWADQTRLGKIIVRIFVMFFGRGGDGSDVEAETMALIWCLYIFS